MDEWGRACKFLVALQGPFVLPHGCRWLVNSRHFLADASGFLLVAGLLCHTCCGQGEVNDIRARFDFGGQATGSELLVFFGDDG